MRKQIISSFLFLYIFSAVFIQTAMAQQTTRAVVIGISNYQDEKISDLKFSHKDAGAFVSFLKSEAGGTLPENQIRMLTNSDATAAKIFREMDWLLTETKEGDRVIIYFSGHGDVETKTIRQRGYLLAHDTPFNNYRVGAIGLDDLNDILATLSQNNKAKIILITDACHSGNLAGKEINGTQATATTLSNQFANEIKIMSCQPNEISLEGKQWGGGRGLFSYHFIEGLMGMADHDDNLKVTLKEIGRYLEDNVTEEAAPDNQNPMVVGDRNARLSFVNEAILVQLKETKQNQGEDAATLASRKPKSNILAHQDSIYQQMYQEFETALVNKYFLPNDWKEGRAAGQSASELYDVLKSVPEMEPLRNTMKGNLAAALQDDAQQSLIAYLNTDEDEMKKRREAFGAGYQSTPAYLAKAAELLGPDHYLYDKILARQYYFEGLLLRLEADRDEQVALYDSAMVRTRLALQYDDQAAYIYNEIGLINLYTNQFNVSLTYFDSALQYTPTWVLPYSNKMVSYRSKKAFHLADSMGQIVLELDSTQYKVYYDMALAYEEQNKKEKAKKMYIKFLEKYPDYVKANNNLGLIYQGEGNYDLAEFYLKRTIELDSSYILGHQNIAYNFYLTAKPDSAIMQLNMALGIDSTVLDVYISLAYQLMYSDQFLSAKETLEKINSKFPNHVEYNFGLACWNALQGNTAGAVIELEKAIQKGIKADRIKGDEDLNGIRDSDAYKHLMTEHFGN